VTWPEHQLLPLPSPQFPDLLGYENCPSTGVHVSDTWHTGAGGNNASRYNGSTQNHNNLSSDSDDGPAAAKRQRTAELGSNARHGRTSHKSKPTHRRRSSRQSGSDSNGSDSDHSVRGPRTFQDAAGREVVKNSSNTTVLIKQTDAIRTLAGVEQMERLLKEPGNELNHYTVKHLCTGAVNLFIMRQAHEGPGLHDPSWYQTPAFQATLWYQQRESNSAIAQKALFFQWGLSRNWDSDSLRPFHFLPAHRAAELSRLKYKCTRGDWLDALRGMAATYGVFYDDSYDRAFLEMVSLAYSQQAGQSYLYDYLESTLNDMLFRFFDAARNPTHSVILPGGSKPRVPLLYTPSD
jgi:hypothetical protein